MWIEPPVDLDGQVVKRPGQVSRNYHLQHVCWQILTRPFSPFVYVVAIHRLVCITIWKFNPFGFISTRYDNLFPEALFYSFLANFATRTASFIFFYWQEALRAKKRKPLVKTVGILTFMPSASERRLWLEDIFNCSTSHMIGWGLGMWLVKRKWHLWQLSSAEQHESEILNHLDQRLSFLSARGFHQRFASQISK